MKMGEIGTAWRIKMKMIEKINTKAVKDTSINTIAITLTSSGAIALTAGNYFHGSILILSGAALEYLKYHWRFLSKKIN